MTPGAGNDGLVPAGTIAPGIVLPLLDAPDEKLSLTHPGVKGLTLAAFFKESCPTCRFTLPFLDRLHGQVAAHGGSVLGISQNDAEETDALRADLDLSLPILIDAPDLKLSRWFDLVSVPTLYLIDEQGAVVRGGMGFNKRELTDMADALASSVGAPRPTLWSPSQEIPESRPG